ncbi:MULTISPECIES: glycosyltransferase family 2 protein [Chryseobacterium]|jgi:teichuronic acid biosynthesis glycosyltransferase TuaG|uniref:Glycosyltransferase n=1 Tax=Chryseobacterium gambrini TaxID=373672 RepID=A0AAJ1R3D6_9FLAO|nr:MULTISPECIES: glycosyltransferase [Chryseobacterium]MDN4012913.1 glycosyltransferase [Chryseobacterium gambrini]MDN4030578.1 glycosyltransferase [Chryseobacterium gambrini]QWA36551.1 glycosyltransferase [Chryseobacterium sp. ZHDP1]
MKDLVSIITPSYNSAEFIEETIQSVLNQTYENWEWLISDDRSKDDTVDLIRKYNDPRIKLHVLEKNGGAGNARNKSLERAEGRYIAFLDSDDFWYPEYLEEMIGFMDKNNAELVYCNYSRCDEHTMEPILKDFEADKIVTFSNLLKTCRLAPVSTMYDTKRVGKFFFPVKSKREDHVMWLNLLKKIPKGYPLNKTLAKYRMRENSVSRKKKNIIRDQYLVYKDFMGFSVTKSLYYTANWAFNGFLKYSKIFN